MFLVMYHFCYCLSAMCTKKLCQPPDFIFDDPRTLDNQPAALKESKLSQFLLQMNARINFLTNALTDEPI